MLSTAALPATPSSTTKPSDVPITAADFRDSLSQFASGVTIVTIKAGPEIHGLTVSAFTSISPEPPLIAIAIDRRHTAHRLLTSEGAVFAVNILGEGQEELSERFAWTKEADRFTLGRWSSATTGAPVLDDAAAWLDCTVHSRATAGTHTVFVGEVQANHAPRPGDRPLVYWNRDYRRLAIDDGAG